MLSQPATPRTGQAACQALLLTAPRDAVHRESQGLSACSLLVLGTEMGCKAEMGAATLSSQLWTNLGGSQLAKKIKLKKYIYLRSKSFHFLSMGKDENTA